MLEPSDLVTLVIVFKFELKNVSCHVKDQCTIYKRWQMWDLAAEIWTKKSKWENSSKQMPSNITHCQWTYLLTLTEAVALTDQMDFWKCFFDESTLMTFNTDIDPHVALENWITSMWRNITKYQLESRFQCVVHIVYANPNMYQIQIQVQVSMFRLRQELSQMISAAENKGSIICGNKKA